jgi:N-acetylmuramoyl-L-alanine amidase
MIMMRLLSLVLVAGPAFVSAQSQEPLRIEVGGNSAKFVAHARGSLGVHYAVSALEKLGGTLEPMPHGMRVLLYGDTLLFEAGSPFFRDRRGKDIRRTRQLVSATYVDDDHFELPAQFFIEWLPARFPDRVSCSNGVLHAPATSGAVAQLATPAAQPSPRRERAAEPKVLGEPRSAAPLRIIVLDAGHGGNDPGKIGPNGLREKDVTMQITRRLAGLLRDRGYEVHLTRTTDTLISLADRPRFANKWKAGRPSTLYMSIHANAGDKRATGFETYFLSDARTEDERRVAEMENAAESFEDHTSADGVPETEKILNGLRNDYYIKASDDLAEIVQKRLGAFHPGVDRGVKRAGFRVLVGAFMPAVLVETAFISNAREASLLGSSAFQQKMAFALADAVDRFFATHEHLWTAEPTQ